MLYFAQFWNAKAHWNQLFRLFDFWLQPGFGNVNEFLKDWKAADVEMRGENWVTEKCLPHNRRQYGNEELDEEHYTKGPTVSFYHLQAEQIRISSKTVISLGF